MHYLPFVLASHYHYVHGTYIGNGHTCPHACSLIYYAASICILEIFIHFGYANKNTCIFDKKHAANFITLLSLSLYEESSNLYETHYSYLFIYEIFLFENIFQFSTEKKFSLYID